ncbi:DUF4129 domain-containing protein [Flavobacterium zepuense]|uniref:DUF4129 domain-containing protein n=1 Tax=Flavobacterium zepuense TaxID=2593302 RepID=A0A552VAD1_9FLAO|nr:DUF4129 domain-containing protein [Flavobacterium zepuense]TRW27433.1 DUF4129 domain-containing protein [Flavobacterium zepuense]
MNKHTLHIITLCTPLLLTAQQPQETAVKDTVVTEVVNFKPVAQEASTVVVTPVPLTQKRSFKDGFKSKYNGPEFTYVVKAKAKFMWDRFLEWLAWLIDAIFGGGEKTKNSGWVAVLIRVLAFAVIGFVVYIIVRSIMNKEGLWIFGRSRKNIGVQDADVENIHEMDFNALIEDTKANGNYKLAVRYYYLWLLKKLSAREIIDWHWDKTNMDYLYEIKDNALRADFEYLSYVYDHSWYGDFPVDGPAFAKAEKAFKKTFNTL